MGAMVDEIFHPIEMSPGRSHVKCSTFVLALSVDIRTGLYEEAYDREAVRPRALSGEPERGVASIAVLCDSVQAVHIHAAVEQHADPFQISFSGSRMDGIESCVDGTPGCVLRIQGCAPLVRAAFPVHSPIEE